jgi:spoIIIJ-associated protein
MSNGDQGEAVTVQDRPSGESDGAAGTISDSAVEASGAEASSVAVLTAKADVADVVGADSHDVEGPADSTDAAIAGVADGADSAADSDEGDAASGAVTAGASATSASAADSAADEDGTEAPVAGPTRSSRGSVRDLEEEGEVAADYLEELLDIVDVDGDIDIDVENGRASLAIVAEGGSDRSLRRLVGANGEVLEALQELTRLAVQASTGERSRLMLDVAGHRAQRRKVLTDRATQACQEVKASGKPLSLESMSAFERKIVHDAVAGAGLESESEGVDPNRHVVILPAAS